MTHDIKTPSCPHETAMTNKNTLTGPAKIRKTLRVIF